MTWERLWWICKPTYNPPPLWRSQNHRFLLFPNGSYPAEPTKEPRVRTFRHSQVPVTSVVELPRREHVEHNTVNNNPSGGSEVALRTQRASRRYPKRWPLISSHEDFRRNIAPEINEHTKVVSIMWFFPHRGGVPKGVS